MREQHFHTKLPGQKPMLRQIEWGIQTGHVTKNGLLPLTTSYFWKFYLSIRISYKIVDLIHIRIALQFYIRVYFSCEDSKAWNGKRFMTREVKTDKQIWKSLFRKCSLKLTFIKSSNEHNRDQIISRIYLYLPEI